MSRSRKGNTLSLPPIDRVYAVRPNSARIVDVYRLATVEELDAGLSWYRDANSIAKALCPSDVSKAAGVIAALSPMMGWGRNVMLAGRAFEDGKASGALGRNTDKADRIMSGENPLDVLGGDKVVSFFQCIVNPDNNDFVCIDRHAFDIAMGRVTNNKTRGALNRVGVYESFAKSYRIAAKVLSREGTSVTAAQVQAVTWTVWRRLKDITDY